MNRKQTRKVALLGAVALTSTFLLTGCTEMTVQDKAYVEQDKRASDRTPPDVSGDTEYDNYVKAQELYDDPNSIIWCTTSFPSAASPIITIPIAGKLTSSSVSYYPGAKAERHGDTFLLAETRSVDGMFHGQPPKYRYGFTPGGVYVDFTDLPVLCTTSLTEFQRQTLAVSVTADADDVTRQAEDLLRGGDPAGAQDLLDGLAR